MYRPEFRRNQPSLSKRDVKAKRIQITVRKNRIVDNLFLTVPILLFDFLVVGLRIHVPQGRFIGTLILYQFHCPDGGKHGMVHVVVAVLAVAPDAVQIMNGVQLLLKQREIFIAAIVGGVGFLQAFFIRTTWPSFTAP